MQQKITRIIARPLVAVAFLGLVGTTAHAQQPNQANLEAQIKSALNITSKQEGAWKKFVAAYNNPFKPSKTLNLEQYNALPLPKRVAFLKKTRSEETAFVNKRHDASLALYKVLDANQQKVFNDMNAMRPPQQKAAPKPKKK